MKNSTRSVGYELVQIIKGTNKIRYTLKPLKFYSQVIKHGFLLDRMMNKANQTLSPSLFLTYVNIIPLSHVEKDNHNRMKMIKIKPIEVDLDETFAKVNGLDPTNSGSKKWNRE